MKNPTADWEKVGDKFYRKIQLYTAVFDKDLELENYIVSGCSYGGAIGEFYLCKAVGLHKRVIKFPGGLLKASERRRNACRFKHTNFGALTPQFFWFFIF